MSIAITILLLTANIIQLIILFNIENLLKKSNLKLIQLYLDMKFISKLIRDNLYLANSPEFCQKIISDIIEYFNLEDLIILDYVKGPSSQSDPILRFEILEFISKNDDKIRKYIEQDELMKIKFSSKLSKNLLLYISPLNYKDSEAGMIVCVENEPAFLSALEMSTLKSCLDLLKTRLLQVQG